MGNCKSLSSQPLSPVRAPPPQVGDPSLFRLEKSSAAIPYRDLILLDKVPTACPPWEAVHSGTFYSVPVLIKRLPKSNQELVDLFECAVKVMVNISHPNLVQFLGASTDSTHSLYMVTEKLDKGNLAALLASDESLSPSMCLVFMLDIAQGMKYFHSHTPCIPHSHLKAANLPILNLDGKASSNHYHG
ncbi:hypothetical protein THRCLA_09895 [Thraustotheca clavata]|uniref:Protein kinase domain-containing protein n=1 Tax=Thraustotheca clavata TaxID=74557 RepID=A0A1V9YTS1_9STRA|nr:hypothetical protein THRCLA_09895 [Thraustotheca clavata]